MSLRQLHRDKLLLRLSVFSFPLMTLLLMAPPLTADWSLQCLWAGSQLTVLAGREKFITGCTYWENSLFKKICATKNNIWLQMRLKHLQVMQNLHLSCRFYRNLHQFLCWSTVNMNVYHQPCFNALNINKPVQLRTCHSPVLPRRLLIGHWTVLHLWSQVYVSTSGEEFTRDGGGYTGAKPGAVYPGSFFMQGNVPGGVTAPLGEYPCYKVTNQMP